MEGQALRLSKRCKNFIDKKCLKLAKPFSFQKVDPVDQKSMIVADRHDGEAILK